MKLLISTFVSLLLIGFSGASYGQIPAELDEAVLVRSKNMVATI